MPIGLIVKIIIDGYLNLKMRWVFRNVSKKTNESIKIIIIGVAIGFILFILLLIVTTSIGNL